MKSQLLAIIGKSGSGKTSIKAALEKKGFTSLPECTNRETRPGEVDGREYYFFPEERMKKPDVICKKEYKTTKGLWIYGILKTELEADKQYVVIINPYQYQELKKEYEEAADINVFYIDTNEENRMTKLIQREMEKPNPDYQELCRRFCTDAYDYSNDNIDMKNLRKNVFLLYNNYKQSIEKMVDELMTYI